MNKNSLKQVNILREILLDDKVPKVGKTTVEAVFRTLIEPVIECKDRSLVLVRTQQKQSFENILKRINFVNPNIYSFGVDYDFLKKVDGNFYSDTCEFLIILSSRYSCAILWDYDLGKELG